MATSKIQTGLRLDDDLLQKVKALAALENRSVNNLAEYVIRKYVADYEAEHGPLIQPRD